MLPVDRLSVCSDERYAASVVRALDWQRLGAAAAVALLLSLGPLVGSDALQYLSPAEAAWAWAEHLLELLVLGAALAVAYTLIDEALPERTPLRAATICAALLALSVALTVLLYRYYGHDLAQLPPTLRLFADSLRWGLPAVALVLVADLHRRALRTEADASIAELSRERLRNDESEQQLALLQAQLEPHFLFNVLGTVRRLYRTRPQAGADAIGNLMRYFEAALPMLRAPGGTLGDELALAGSYLQLCRLRMGRRMSFAIEVEQELAAAEFPPIVLLTLVENAIKHGLEPAGGGEVRLRARRRRDVLEVSVLDDGVGFASAGSEGTGVGLANVRRQLARVHGPRAGLDLRAREPRGAIAVIRLPLRLQTTPATRGGRT